MPTERLASFYKLCQPCAPSRGCPPIPFKPFFLFLTPRRPQAEEYASFPSRILLEPCFQSPSVFRVNPLLEFFVFALAAPPSPQIRFSSRYLDRHGLMDLIPRRDDPTRWPRKPVSTLLCAVAGPGRFPWPLPSTPFFLSFELQHR